MGGRGRGSDRVEKMVIVSAISKKSEFVDDEVDEKSMVFRVFRFATHFVYPASRKLTNGRVHDSLVLTPTIRNVKTDENLWS